MLESGNMYISEWVLLPSIDKKFQVYIYSLAKFIQKKGFNLVLVKIEGGNRENEFIVDEKLLNSYISQQKIFFSSAGLPEDEIMSRKGQYSQILMYLHFKKVEFRFL